MAAGSYMERSLHAHDFAGGSIKEEVEGDNNMNLYPVLTHRKTARRISTRSKWSSTFFVFAATFALALAVAAPARADFCIQLNGGPV